MWRRHSELRSIAWCSVSHKLIGVHRPPSLKEQVPKVKLHKHAATYIRLSFLKISLHLNCTIVQGRYKIQHFSNLFKIFCIGNDKNTINSQVHQFTVDDIQQQNSHFAAKLNAAVTIQMNHKPQKLWKLSMLASPHQPIRATCDKGQVDCPGSTRE